MKPLVLQGHSRPIKNIKFSSKGDTIFTASNDRNVIMWKTETGEKINTYIHAAAVTIITLTCDMKYIITGDSTGCLYIWDSETGNNLIKLEQDPMYCIRSVDLTLNDYLIMILYASRMKNSKSFICVYKLQDIINSSNNLGEKHEENKKIEVSDDFFDSIDLNKKQNNSLKIEGNQNLNKKENKNIQNKIQLNTNNQGNNSSSNLYGSKQTTFNPTVIDLTSSNNKLELFKYLECKTKETKYVQAKFSSLNKCLLVSREDGFLELINFNNGKLITEYKFHDDIILDFDIDTKRGIILTASRDGYACVINFDTFQVLNKLHPLNPTRNLNACKIINFENPFYDPESDKIKTDMFSVNNINNFVNNLFNPNQDKKGGSGVINLDIDSLFNSTSVVEKIPQGINTKDKEISFSIISGGQDSKLVTTTNQKEGGFDVLIYNSVTGEEMVKFQDHFGPINTIACNQNAKIMASGAEDATIRLYKLENYLLNNNINEKR